jgi:UDP-N-acetylglucosamine--N-acetylmuramyl-(pentapeptide) pyrophosphoryl-undecaprenol N-acetylglucosamine transferase
LVFDPDTPLVVITGGGLGAGHVNEAVAKELESLLKLTSVMLLSGAEHYNKARTLVRQNDKHFQLLPFINSDTMVQALGAADVVVSRAGATTILELSALAKPTILIPAAHLAAGHQLKNAAEYAEGGAAEVIEDSQLATNPSVLVNMIGSLLDNPAKLKQMGAALHARFKPNGAVEVADLIENATKR